MIPTVVCVLRAGKEYKNVHVGGLLKGVLSHWPRQHRLRVVVLTDSLINKAALEELQELWASNNCSFEVRPLRQDWPGWWAKMEMFSAEHDDLGDILYFDLDTLVVGPLDDIVQPFPKPILLSDFYHPEKLATGMMYLPLGSRPDVYAGWIEMKNEFMRRERAGDGDYMDFLWRGVVGRWQNLVPHQVVSYKIHVVPKLRGYPINTPADQVPKGARVICFHGKPRPWDTPLWNAMK